MWVKASKDKFEEYGQVIDVESNRKLADGEYIRHFELTGTNTSEAEAFFVKIRLKTSFTVLTNEEMDELLKLEPQEA